MKNIFWISLLFICATHLATAQSITLDRHPKHGQALVTLPLKTPDPNMTNLIQLAKHMGSSPGHLYQLNPSLFSETNTPHQSVNIHDLFTHNRIITPNIIRPLTINIPERRLYFFDAETLTVTIYPIAVGKLSTPTPNLGISTITEMVPAPNWYPSDETKAYYAIQKGITLPNAIPPGPNNPMGVYKIRLNGSSYLIHGTNKPHEMGLPASLGCFRMFNDHISTLKDRLHVNDQVMVMNQPIKWVVEDDFLWVEAHPQYPLAWTQEDINEWIHNLPIDPLSLAHYQASIIQIIQQANGLPQLLGPIYESNRS